MCIARKTCLHKRNRVRVWEIILLEFRKITL
jgi:hypothetical protein